MITFKAKTESGEIINSALSPFTFPAGEAHTKREERRELEPTEIAIIQADQNMHDDLFQLAMWSDYVERSAKRVLIMPYFPGARADRGNPIGIGVYASFIEYLYLDQIITFDIHSSTSAAILEDCVGGDTYKEVDVDELLNQRYIKNTLSYDGVIAPDKGAVFRAKAVADVIQVPLYTAEKTRNFETGQLTGFDIEPLPEEGNFLIVDDICDGGGTFLGLAEVIKERHPSVNLDLYVSHGVFSKGLPQLLEKFDNIITTNSYNTPIVWMYPGYKRLDVIRLLLDEID